MSGYSVKLPLSYDLGDGPYALNKDLASVVKQNLKMLILTNPGERVMDTDFGVGAKSLLFNNINSEENGRIQSKIYEQINKYLPFVVIESINIQDSQIDTSLNDNSLSISIQYYVPNLKQQDTLNIILSSN